MAERVIIRKVTGNAISAMVTGELGYDEEHGILILAGFGGVPGVALANDPGTSGAVATERTQRIAADNALQDDIDAEATTRGTNDSTLAARTQAAATKSVTSPVGTTSTTYTMQGLALHLTIPPRQTRALVMLAGQIGNSGAGGEAFARLTFGTGAAPANGDAVTGTAIGAETHVASTSVPFSQHALLDTLTPGTNYWIDVALKAAAGGTASLANLQLTALSLIDSVTLP